MTRSSAWLPLTLSGWVSWSFPQMSSRSALKVRWKGLLSIWSSVDPLIRMMLPCLPSWHPCRGLTNRSESACLLTDLFSISSGTTCSRRSSQSCRHTPWESWFCNASISFLESSPRQSMEWRCFRSCRRPTQVWWTLSSSSQRRLSKRSSPTTTSPHPFLAQIGQLPIQLQVLTVPDIMAVPTQLGIVGAITIANTTWTTLPSAVNINTNNKQPRSLLLRVPTVAPMWNIEHARLKCTIVHCVK